MEISLPDIDETESRWNRGYQCTGQNVTNFNGVMDNFISSTTMVECANLCAKIDNQDTY